MKKSQMYNLAMIAVMNCGLDDEEKLEVLELLMDNKSVALYTERQEAEKSE